METQAQLKTVELVSGANLRIMSWNILSEELTPWAPKIEDRIDGICETIREYAPDAAGIQEISESGYQLLGQRLGDTYEFVHPITKEGNFSYTGVAYNKNKYHLIDSDIVNFELGNRRIRIVNWICIQDKVTGQRFVLVSTHWDRHACNRVPQADYMGHMVNKLREQFECPVICTGDFNARESSAAFHTFIKVSHHIDSKYAVENPVNNCFTGHPVGDFTPEFEGTECIDHITFAEGIKPLHYEAVINDKVVGLSDHFPVYVDFRY